MLCVCTEPAALVGQLGFDYVQRQGAGPGIWMAADAVLPAAGYSFPGTVLGHHWNVCGQNGCLLLGKWAGKVDADDDGDRAGGGRRVREQEPSEIDVCRAG